MHGGATGGGADRPEERPLPDGGLFTCEAIESRWEVRTGPGLALLLACPASRSRLHWRRCGRGRPGAKETSWSHASAIQMPVE